jgi:molybdenum cofactor cytidylyltransferase
MAGKMGADRPLLVAMLAAGEGARFGGGKLDADCAGKPLGQWALDAVAEAGFAPGIVVAGTVPPAFTALAAGWEILTNQRADEGQGTSVSLAADVATSRGANLLLLLADMPLLAPAHLLALTQNEVLTATLHSNGSPGVPVFVPYALLELFAGLSGDRGAGPILRSTSGLRTISATHGTLRDVDTSEDLATIAACLLTVHKQAG